MLFLKKSKGALLILASIILILYLVYLLPKPYFDSIFWRLEKSRNFLRCYRSNEFESLPDISQTKPPRNSIFFLETTCNSFENDKITIQRRQACSVESAALTNPNSTVYLLYVSPGNLKLEETESDRLLRAILSYENVNLRHLNFEEYARNSPVDALFDEGQSSKYPQSYVNDVLRFLTLWKYGGVYLDLDVMVFRSLENLASTFVGAQSESLVGSAILRFDSSGPGHEFARKCLEEFARNYGPDKWGYDGSEVLTRLVKKLCGVEKLRDAFNKTCDGVTVYPSPFFFPVHQQDWKRYFAEEFTEEAMCESHNSFAAHMWNQLSGTSAIWSTANVSYIKFAQKFCPKVYRQSPGYF